MTQTLESFVRAAHPHRLVEPLDTTTPTVMTLDGPTVMIEVMGAREALDTLARVRRIVDGTPIAAVRLAPADPARERRDQRAPEHSGDGRRWVAMASSLVGSVAAVLVGVASVRLLHNVPGADRVDNTVDGVMLAIGAAVLAIVMMAASRRWWRDRRLPVERRRYRERRRDSAVIAVPAADERAAAAMASVIRRLLGDASPTGVPCTVSVYRPAHDLGTDPARGE